MQNFIMLDDYLDALPDAVGEIRAEQRQQLRIFLRELYLWNKSYNLTAILEPEAMIIRHILDSLVLLPYFPYEKILDVGSGAGLPGLPLAICLPEQQFFLLDSNSKRTRFIKHVQLMLGIKNITIIHSRVEDYQPIDKFTCITSRAFASLNDMIQWSAHLLAENGEFAAMKGKLIASEYTDLPMEFTVSEIIKLDVPFLDEQRHLIKIRK